MICARFCLLALAAASHVGCGAQAFAQARYDVGASDAEIKVGNIMPYSGPASAYGLLGKTQAAYFRKMNDAGGINGRKIDFISYDDAYSPPKTVEQARKLVESDEVLLLFSPLGTAGNAAIQKYMNQRKVPQLFVASNASKWGDPKHYPWTMGFQPSYRSEGEIYGRYISIEKPDAKVAVLAQNDDLGRDYLAGLKDGLGDRKASIVAEEIYETAEPTIDARIVKLRSNGADVLVLFATPKFTAQSIKKAAEIGWKATIILPAISSSIASVLKPAGLDNAQGVLSATFVKDPDDPAWSNDPAMKDYLSFLETSMPGANKSDNFHILGYVMAQALTEVLRRSGNDLTRANVMRQAADLKKLEIGLLLPGITVNTSPDDFFPIKQMRLMKFEGQTWQLKGDIIESRPVR